MNILLSIIVPTKNRYKYLYSIIEFFIDRLSNKPVQLVIQDNSDNNQELIDYLEKKKVKEIKYCYESKPLSVTENFDLGILNSDGEYVTMLGDDDIVSGYIFQVAEYLKNNNYESAIFNKGNYNHRFSGFNNSRLHTNVTR